MPLPKLNERLINRTIEHIQVFPESYNQNEITKQCEVTKKTPCGAIGCFGGWGLLLSAPKSQRYELAANEGDLVKAAKLFGFTEEEGDYIFAGGSGDPKEDLRTIKSRLKNIRNARGLLNKKVSQLPEEATVSGGELSVEVEDYDGNSTSLTYEL
jgi:hypothetical protein